MKTTHKPPSKASKSAALIPAGGYIRMSTDQQEASPARQKAEILRLAQRTGYRILAWYEDHGLTGTESKNRPEFQRLLIDAKKGKFRAILMFEQSRLSREDHFEAIKHWDALRAVKVEMFDCRRGKIDIETLGGFITAIVDQYGAHDESRKFADRVVSGVMHRIRQGKRASGSALLGFDKLIRDEKGLEFRRVASGEKFRTPKGWTFELVPAADLKIVDAIRWTFQQVCEGASLTSIAANLNRRGIKTRDGKRFQASSIRRMVENPAYAGVLRAGRFSTGKFRRIDEEGIQLVTDAHVGLVTSAVFHDAQDKLKGLSRSMTPTTAGRYLLSGLLICDHCGRKMYGRVAKIPGRSEIQLSYWCVPNTRLSDPDCPRPFLNAPRIEKYILDLIRDRILTDDNRDALLSAAAKWQTQKQRSFEQDQLEEVRRKIERATENLALADADKVQGISDLIDRWRKDEKQLIERIESMRVDVAAPEAAVNAVALLGDMRDDLHKIDRVDLAAAIRNTIREIRVRVRRIGHGKRPGRGRSRGRPQLETMRLFSGVVHFEPTVCPDGSIPFCDSDIFERKWREIVDVVRGSKRPVTLAELSRKLGYKSVNGAHRHVRVAIAAGELAKHPSGVGFIAKSA